MVTISTCAYEELLSFGIACFGGFDLSLGLLLWVLEVFGGEAGSDVGPACLLALW